MQLCDSRWMYTIVSLYTSFLSLPAIFKVTPMVERSWYDADRNYTVGKYRQEHVSINAICTK